MNVIYLTQTKLNMFSINVHRVDAAVDIENILYGRKEREIYAKTMWQSIPSFHYMQRLNYIPGPYDLHMYSLISHDKVSVVKIEQVFLVTNDQLESAIVDLETSIRTRFSEVISEIFTPSVYIYPTIYISRL